MNRYLLFLIVALVLFDNKLSAQDKLNAQDNKNDKYPLLQTDNIYTFDYSNSDQNDCWDVNNANTWKDFAVTSSPMEKETLCRNLVFYYEDSVSDKGNKGACNNDPICEYYRDKYKDNKDNIDKKAGALDDRMFTKNVMVKACQWIPDATAPNKQGVCAPRNDFYIAGYIQVPDGYSKYMNKDDIYIGSRNLHEKNTLSFKDEANRISKLKLKLEDSKTSLSDKPKTKFDIFSSQSIPSEHKKILDNFIYLVKQKDKFLIKNLGLSESYEFKDGDIVTTVDFFDCRFFRSDDKKYTKAVIDSMSNAQRNNGGDNAPKYCSIAVVTATVSQTQDDTPHLFIYNGLYSSFIPVTKSDSGFFTISNDIPDARYSDICKDNKLVNDKIWPNESTINNLITVQAIFGFYGPNKENAVSKSINGSITTFDKLVAIHMYCPEKFSNINIEDKKYVSFIKNYSEKYEAYYKDTNPVGQDKKKTNTEFPQLLSNLAQLKDEAYTSSYFFNFVKASLSENINLADSNKVYADEIKSIFRTSTFLIDIVKLQSPTLMGSPFVFYTLAKHTGFVITTAASNSPDVWILAPVQTTYMKTTDQLFNKFNNFMMPELYAQTNINSAANSFTYTVNDGKALEAAYNQANSVPKFSDNYLSSLYTMNAAISHPTEYLNDAALGNDYNGTGSKTKKDKATGKGGFWKFLGSDSTAKLGMMALSYYMTDKQTKLDSARIKAQLEMESLKARMNQCSSMDCQTQQNLCLIQQIPCRTNRTIIFTWTWGKKDDMCYIRDLKDSDEYKKCTTCDPIYTNTQPYVNPFTYQSEQMTLYQICLMNVTNSLLNRNKCFDLMSLNAQIPGAVTNADIRSCFLGLKANNNPLSFSYPNPLATAQTQTPVVQAAEKKKDAPTTAAPAGGGAPSSPGSGVEKSASQKPEDIQYGKYKEQSSRPSGFYPGQGYGQPGGNYNANGDTKQISTLTPTIPGTPAELTIKSLMNKNLRITGDEINKP